MQPAMEAGNPVKGKPAESPEHGDVGDQDPRVGDLDHGDQIVDALGPGPLEMCPRTVRQVHRGQKLLQSQPSRLFFTASGWRGRADLTVWRRERAVSAVERKPAQLVAQPLVVEHKFSDLVGELGALPLALPTAGLHAVAFSRCRPRGLDRVCRGSEFVGRHMAHRGGLAGSVRGMACCPAQVSGRGVCMAGRRAGLSPGDLTPRPGTPEVNRPTWTVVLRPCLLEVVQHVRRAVSRPHREKTMIVVLEDPAATHGDESRISDLGEDHQLAHLALVCAKGSEIGLRRT
jgi:hypothetical protein